MEILTGMQQTPWKTLIYGPPGIGKSTLASRAPKPIVIDVEGGVKRIDVPKTKQVQKLEDFHAAMRFLITERHQFKTVIVDTVDVLETFIHEYVCRHAAKDSIEDFGYGKGYKIAQEEWMKVLKACDLLNAKGINALLIAHDQTKVFRPPNGDEYERYQIRINQNTASLIVGKMDAVLYAHYELVMKTDGGNKDRQFASTTGRRFIQCQESLSVIAKNRFGLDKVEVMSSELFNKFGNVDSDDANKGDEK